MPPRALVSVVLPVYNAGAFLRPAVESVFAAAGGAEAIVVDDGSTDRSVASLAGLPVRVIRQSNGGEASARNAGVRASTGRYVTFLDGDDLLAPDGLAERLEFLERHPGSPVVAGLPSTLIDGAGTARADVFAAMGARLAFPLRLTLDRYRAGEFFPVNCSLYLYRRAAFDRTGPFDETLRLACDCDFHYRLLRWTEVPVLRTRTFERRLHGGNVSLVRARGGRPRLRPEVLEAIRRVNRRHGMAPADVSPWELDYL